MQDMIDTLGRLGKEAPKMVKQSLGRMFTVYKKSVKSMVPLRKSNPVGEVNRNIIRVVNSKVSTKQAYVERARVGVGVGIKKQFAVPHAHFLALGTRPRWTGQKDIRSRRKGKQIIVGKRLTGNPIQYRGFVKPNDFVMRGVNAAQSQANQVFQESLKQKIQASMGTTGVVK